MRVQLTWDGKTFEVDLEQQVEDIEVSARLSQLQQSIGVRSVRGRLVTLPPEMCIPSEIKVTGEVFSGTLQILPGGYLRSNGAYEWCPQRNPTTLEQKLAEMTRFRDNAVRDLGDAMEALGRNGIQWKPKGAAQ